MSEALILGIESTCDETGVAFVRGHELLADVTASSMDQHARYGGIIPEIASRAHLECFIPTLEAAAKEAGVSLADVDAVACAAGPGLVGSLTVGISAAKALALTLGKPLYGVNHVIGHLAVDQLEHGAFPERFIGLIVSGGHSNLVLVDNIATSVRELGGTLDDAAGEAFDKVGRLLHTPYPGGPHVDRMSREGNRKAIRFPRGLQAGKDKERHRYNFSFSGLKTAVARYVEGLEAQGLEVNKEDICAGFSEAVNDSLTAKAIQAAKDFDCSTIVVGGGFSANSRLRELLGERGAAAGIEIRIPKLRFCTDNGAQIAALGANLVAAGCAPSPIDFGPDSALSLSRSYVAPTETLSPETQPVETATSVAVTKSDGGFAELLAQPKKTAQKAAGSDGSGAENAQKAAGGADQLSTSTDAVATVDKTDSTASDADEGARWDWVKDNLYKSFEYLKPTLEQAYEALEHSAEQAYEKAKPYLEQARPYLEQAKPYFDQAKPYLEHAKPHFEQAKPYLEHAKPYLEQARPYLEQAKPYLEQATEKTRSYAQQAGQRISNTWSTWMEKENKDPEPSVAVEPPDDILPNIDQNAGHNTDRNEN